MNSISVETERLLNAANQIEKAAGDYRETVSLLYGDIERMSEVWKGNDNVAFTNQISAYRKDFQKIDFIIQEYVEYLRNSARAYEQTQNELASAAGRLKM